MSYIAKLITAKEAGKPLNAPEYEVLRMAREGILPPGVVVRLGRKVRFNEQKLFAWIEAGGAPLPGGWRREPAEAATAAG